jgi:hypothetical protein
LKASGPRVQIFELPVYEKIAMKTTGFFVFAGDGSYI